MSGQNLIVDDDYFAELGRFFSSRNEIEGMIDDYVDALKLAHEQGVKSGETADALVRYTAYAEMLKGKMQAINDDLVKLADGYMQSIDQADDYLF